MKKNTGYSYEGKTIWVEGDWFYIIRNGRAETLPQMYQEKLRKLFCSRQER